MSRMTSVPRFRTVGRVCSGRRTFRAAVLWCFFLATICPATAALVGSDDEAAPRYRLLNGRGYSVCEAFLKNLNAFQSSEPPMVCEQKIHPSHPEFSKPVWEELDVQSNLKLIYAAEKQIWILTPVGTEPPPFEDWRQRFEQRVKSGEAKPRLRRMMVALNKRRIETIISYDPSTNDCETELRNHWGSLGTAGGHMFVLRDDAEKSLEPFGGGTGTQDRVSVLMYRLKPFFVSLGSDGPRWIMGLHPPAEHPTYDGLYILHDRCAYTFDK